MQQTPAPQSCPTPRSEGHSPPAEDQNQSSALSAQQFRAIDLMLQGATDTATAQEVSVDRRTIYRWRRMPAFARELEQRRRALRSMTSDRLNALLPVALEVIGRQMRDALKDRAFRAAALVLRTVAKASQQRAADRTSQPDDVEP